MHRFMLYTKAYDIIRMLCFSTLTQQKCFIIKTYFYNNLNKAIAPFLISFHIILLRQSILSIKLSDNKSLF